jgi:hypothetical protein
VAEASAAFLIADDDERGEREILTALHDLGDAVDGDELIDELAFSAFLVLRLTATTAITARPTAGTTRTTAGTAGPTPAAARTAAATRSARTAVAWLFGR